MEIKRVQLIDHDSIWNAVVDALSEYEYPGIDEKMNEAFLIFQYYSEMENGGHEAFIESMNEDIQKIGIDHIIGQLVNALNKVNQNAYAVIIKSHFKEIWNTHCELQHDETIEDSFYQHIEKADQAYYDLNDKLSTSLEAYFIKIHEDILNIID